MLFGLCITLGMPSCYGLYHLQWYFVLGGVPALGKLKDVVGSPLMGKVSLLVALDSALGQSGGLVTSPRSCQSCSMDFCLVSVYI